MQGGLQRIIIGGGSHEVIEIDSIGTVKVGSSSLNGTFELYGGAGEDPAVRIENYFLTGGGQIGINDGSGNMHTQLRTDGNSVGGYLRITRNNAESGFVVDGNYNGTQLVPRCLICRQAGTTRLSYQVALLLQLR